MTQSILLRFRPYVQMIIYAMAVLWATALFFYVSGTIPEQSTAFSVLMRYYGLTSLYLLFLVFVPGLLMVYAPKCRFNAILLHARRAIGVSVFFFGLVHGLIGFFNNLGGSAANIKFLPQSYQISLMFSTIAFCILLVLALTSFDYAMRLLGRKWKMLHRLVYLAAILLVFHAFLMGSHFTNPYGFIPLSVNFLALIILILEAGATVKRMRSKKTIGSARKWFTYIAAIVVVVLAVSLSLYSLLGSSENPTQNIVSEDLTYALDLSLIPTMPLPNQTVELTFTVSEALSKKPVETFRVMHEKLMHVILVSSDLRYYDHIHPEHLGNGTFIVETQFPAAGHYMAYVEYAPGAEGESLNQVPLQIGNSPQKVSAILVPDTRTKTFEEKYSISLLADGPLQAKKGVVLSYGLSDAKTAEAITDLEPYLGAFGHLAIISEDLTTFTHVHPLDIPITDRDRFGPTVRFHTEFPTAGRYKLFAQFKHDGEVFVTDFVVDVVP